MLDTHVLVWLLQGGRDSFPDQVKEVLADGSGEAVFSAVVVWEISIKRALGKLDVPANLTHFLEASGARTLPVSIRHAELAGALPLHHRDPFDRMLVAQSMTEGMPIITADDVFDEYDVQTIWN